MSEQPIPQSDITTQAPTPDMELEDWWSDLEHAEPADPEALDRWWEQEVETTHVGHEHVLGSKAVAEQLNRTGILLDASEAAHQINEWAARQPGHDGQRMVDQAANDHKRAIEDNRLLIKYGAEDIRSELTYLTGDPLNQRILDDYLQNPETALPQIFEDWRNQSGLHWHAWLTKGASGEQLMNFAQWHNHRMVEAQQDPDLQARIGDEKQMYKICLQQAIKDGHLPEFLSHDLDRIDEIKVYIGDVFDTLMQDRGGYHIRTTDYVVVAENGIEHATMHELDHAFLGSLPFVWLDEAMTEHIAQGFKKGDFLTIDAHNTKRGAYEEERGLLDDVAMIIAGGDSEYKNKQEVVADLVMAYADGFNQEALLGKINAALSRVIQKRFEPAGEPLEIINHAIEQRHKEQLELGWTGRFAMTEALRIVRSDILQQPEVVFGAKTLQPA